MKLATLKDLRYLRSNNPNSKIVMVNGAFDLFHKSHLELLRFAKKKGDILVVCITSDESLRVGKGNGRPIITQADRAAILDAIKYVDYVFMNSSNQSDDLKNWPAYHLRPNLLISGDKRWFHTDPRVKDLGIVTLLVERGEVSTTAIINRIRNV
jgi:D-beta-D-heptose 7-phosphate kinase / D-beta-D-heptose 1-phosphate adenosyltransferase